MATHKISIAYLNDNGEDRTYKFKLNPNKIDHEYMSAYAPVPVAQADWQSSGASKYRPVVWVRNEPERINIEFLLASDDSIGLDGANIIEKEISKLEAMRRKDPKTGEPPDLVLQISDNEYHVVRLDRMRITPKVWAQKMQRRIAQVSMDFIIISPRRGK